MSSQERDPQIALSCRGLVKRYGDVTAVNGLDLEVRRGECLGLLGPNGAGKTTTVEILEGLTEASEGVVEVLGQPWGRDDAALRQRLGVQLQETLFPEKLTVEECLRLFRSFYDQGRTVDEVLAEVQLGEKRRARFEKLSGGQKQRLSIACALVGDPEVLFLDEPTTGLDPQARLKLWEIVEAFRESGGTVLLTTHYMEEATRLCDRVAVVDHGKLIALGSPAELIASLGADQIIDLKVNGVLDLEELQGLPGVNDAYPAGDGYLLHAAEAGNALPALLALLDQRGLHLDGLTTHEATLEDVFVHLTGRGLRDG